MLRRSCYRVITFVCLTLPTICLPAAKMPAATSRIEKINAALHKHIGHATTTLEEYSPSRRTVETVTAANALHMNPNNYLIVKERSDTPEDTILCFNAQTSKFIWALREQHRTIIDVDAKYVYILNSSQPDQTVHIQDIHTGEIKKTLDLKLSPTIKKALDLKLSQAIKDVELSPDGKALIVNYKEHRSSGVFKIETGELIRMGRVIGCHNNFILFMHASWMSPSDIIEFFNIETQKTAFEVNAHSFSSMPSFGEKYIALEHSDDSINIFDTQTGAPAMLFVSAAPVSDFLIGKLTPKDVLLVKESLKKELMEINIDTGKVTPIYKSDESPDFTVNDVSPDGNTCTLKHRQGKTTLLSIQTGEHTDFPCEQFCSDTCMAFLNSNFVFTHSGYSGRYHKNYTHGRAIYNLETGRMSKGIKSVTTTNTCDRVALLDRANYLRILHVDYTNDLKLLEKLDTSSPEDQNVAPDIRELNCFGQGLLTLLETAQSGWDKEPPQPFVITSEYQTRFAALCKVLPYMKTWKLFKWKPDGTLSSSAYDGYDLFGQ